MINKIESCLKSLEINRSYILFLRQWMPFGLDTILYSMDGEGRCKKICGATGESSEPVEQQVLINSPIDGASYMELLMKIMEAGFMELPAVTQPECTANCNDFYAVKLLDGIQKLVRVPGGSSANQAQVQIAELLVGQTLDDFYRRLML